MEIPLRRGLRRLLFVAGGVVALAAVVWAFVPLPFVRGLILGFVAAPLVLTGTLMVVARVARRRGAGAGRDLEPPPLPTTTWDYSMDLEDLEGAAVDLSTWRDRVLVLNFWATWCAPCVAELPSLQGLREATAELGVRFGFVTREDPSTVRRFLADRGLELPVYILSGEPPACFTARAVPATYVVDRNGLVALRHVGAAAWDADGVIAFVRGLAAAPA